MTAQRLFEAIGRIDDEYVARAEAFLDEASASPEALSPSKARRISPKIARALAAAAIVAAVALGVVMAIPASREAIVEGVSSAANGIARFFGGGDPADSEQTDAAQTDAARTDAEHSEAADGSDAESAASETQSEALTQTDAVTERAAGEAVVCETRYDGDAGFERKRAPGEEIEYTELYYYKTNGLIAGKTESYCRLLDSWDDYVAWCGECGYHRVEEYVKDGVRHTVDVWKTGLPAISEDYFTDRFVVVVYNVFEYLGEYTDFGGYAIQSESGLFEQTYTVIGPLDAARGTSSDVGVIGRLRAVSPVAIKSVAGKYLFHLYTDANGELIFENGAAVRTYPGEPTLYELEKTPSDTDDAQTPPAPEPPATDGGETTDGRTEGVEYGEYAVLGDVNVPGVRSVAYFPAGLDNISLWGFGMISQGDPSGWIHGERCDSFAIVPFYRSYDGITYATVYPDPERGKHQAAISGRGVPGFGESYYDGTTVFALRIAGSYDDGRYFTYELTGLDVWGDTATLFFDVREVPRNTPGAGNGGLILVAVDEALVWTVRHVRTSGHPS